jgi:hypothetical protein
VQYTIRIRLVDGSSITRTVAAKTSSGEYNIIELTASVTTTEAESGNLFMMGELSSESVNLIVQSVEPSSNLTARLTLVDYSPAVYDSDTETIPEFVSNISLPPVLLQQTISDTPTVSSIVSDESVMTRPSPNTFQYRIKVSFTNPNSLPLIAKFVEGQINRSGDSALIWETTKTVPIRDGCIYFDNVKEGEIYKMRLRYATTDGRAGAWTTTSNHTVVGKTTPPSTPLSASTSVSGTQIKLDWADNGELDLWGYEIRSTNSGWGTAGYLYQGASSECLINAGALGVAATYFIKSIDVIGLYSTNALSASFTPSAMPAVSALNYAFRSSSLVTTDLILSWSDVAPQFGLDYYIVSYGSTVVNVKSNTLTVNVDWVGDQVFSIKAVDRLGNQSTTTTATVTKVAPAAPVSGSSTVINASLMLNWVASVRTTLPIAGYEIRTADSGWGTSGYLFKGNVLNFSVIPALGSNTWYVKSYDADNRYSTTALSISYTRAIPLAPTSPVYTFADTSLTNATVTLDWNNATPIFGLDRYKIVYGTEIHYTKSNTITLPADWIGDRVYSITTIDLLNGESNAITVTAPKVVPNPAFNLRAQVIDNNVLLYWDLPAKTTLPIQDVLLKKGETYATATTIGAKSGTFTSISELSGGTYTYWIEVRDTDNNFSTPVGISVAVSQPPDFVFNAQYFSQFTGTKSSAINDSSGLLLPINTTETWNTHFSTRSWTTPAAQIAAGYPIFIQPNETSGSYVEVFDYGTILGGSQVTLHYTGTNIVGTPNVSIDLAISTDGITYTTFAGAESIFATSFRYIKVTVNVTTTAATDLFLLSAMDVLLNAKQSSDSGTVNALSTDASGTIVNFGKEFIDITSIVLTPSGTTPADAVYDYLDTVIAGTYSVTTNVATISVTGHNLLAGQKVRLSFTSGTAPNGVYTVASVVNANQYTVNITTANTSGNISTYPESFRVYLFNSAGVRTSGLVSWSVRGY